ncbi:hypothetical protein [Thalassospira sp.]|uniref:hypothetical protein n=1 Tax=Thalassospira sp. TaxID=1912094 RepID=UPI0032EC4ACA
MQTIEIDFEVFKELTLRRETEATTYNDVVRALLGLGTMDGKDKAERASETWLSKGVAFPVGTEFRVRYKGEMHYGQVQRDGLSVNDVVSASPSDAARLITGNNVNGWRFWECKFPGHGKWQKIDTLRDH